MNWGYTLPSVVACSATALLFNVLLLLIARGIQKRRSQGSAASAKKRNRQIAAGILVLLAEAFILLGFMFSWGYPLAMSVMEPSYRHALFERGPISMDYIDPENALLEGQKVLEEALKSKKIGESSPYNDIGIYISSSLYKPKITAWAIFDQFWEKLASMPDEKQAPEEAAAAKAILKQYTAIQSNSYRPELQVKLSNVDVPITNFFNETNQVSAAKIQSDIPYPEVSRRQQLKEFFSREYTFCQPLVLVDFSDDYESFYFTAYQYMELQEAERSGRAFLKESLVYVTGTVKYSPFLLSFSDFILSCTDTVCLLPCSQWSIGTILGCAIFIVLFLLIEIMSFMRRENKASKARLALFHMVAHELKTPMGVVMLHGEKVLEEQKAAEKDKRALLMIEEIKGMNQRLLDVLAQSRLEGGSYQMRREAVSLRELAEEVAEGYEPLAGEKGVAVEIDGEDLRLYADGYLVKYAISNYLSNAIKHCPQGGQVKIDVQKKKRSALLTVWNSGSHIPQSSLGRIWDPFYKVGDGGDNSKKGSGLGLSIVRSIVSLHGGGCSARNTPDGVAFWCSFPMRKRKKAARRNTQ